MSKCMVEWRRELGLALPNSISEKLELGEARLQSDGERWPAFAGFIRGRAPKRKKTSANPKANEKQPKGKKNGRQTFYPRSLPLTRETRTTRQVSVATPIRDSWFMNGVKNTRVVINTHVQTWPADVRLFCITSNGGNTDTLRGARLAEGIWIIHPTCLYALDGKKKRWRNGGGEKKRNSSSVSRR